MAVEDELIICEICKQGRVTKRMEEMAFRQWSDKGYIHCRVTILIGTCDNCRVKSLDPGSNKILDEAFQREYDKLRWGDGKTNFPIKLNDIEPVTQQMREGASRERDAAKLLLRRSSRWKRPKSAVGVNERLLRIVELT